MLSPSVCTPFCLFRARSPVRRHRSCVLPSHLTVAVAVVYGADRRHGRNQMEIAPGVHRVGTDSKINSYLIEEGGRVTIVDAGVSGLYRELPEELASMGRTLEDVA